MLTTKASASAPFYHLEKPRNSVEEVKEEALGRLIGIYSGDHRAYFERVNEPHYLYWDKIRFKPHPKDSSTEEFWFLVKQIRKIASKSTPIKAESGEFFTWFRLTNTEELLHTIDIHSGGQIFAPNPISTESGRQKLITRGILEEAIASSQLEGAHTTRSVAKKMILEKREPKNESERMILNNYKTITAIESDYKNEPLSVELLFELHKMLTNGTILEENQGRFRKDEDKIVVQGQIGQEVYTTHVPPSEKFLSEEILRLIDYANDKNSETFVHPVIKAIFIHFWIGYLHPFTDGNGRLARALFYWYLLRKNYWTFIYMPISTIIKNAPDQYAMAYIYSEQDMHDLTYFYDFNIKKIMQSIEEFKNYISEKVAENKQIDKIVSNELVINERQRDLIHYLGSSDDGSLTITSHATFNKISRQTAAKDLKELEDVALIEAKREGKSIRYTPTEKLIALMKVA